MTTQLDTGSTGTTTVVSADGTPLLARRTGSGSPLVLVHGGNGGINTFALIVGTLAERHSVWTYSRRGRGGSGDGPDYCLDREIEDVVAVFEAAGGDAHVLGHSGGAAWSLLASPQLAGLRSLVLYEPVLNLDRLDVALVEAVEAAIEAGDIEGAIDVFLPAAGIVEDERSVVRSLEPLWAAICDGARRLGRELRSAVDEGPARLADFTAPDVPTLYLYGEANDAPIFPTLDEVRKMLPDAEVRGLPGQRHLAFAFDPHTFARTVLDFTAAHD